MKTINPLPSISGSSTKLSPVQIDLRALFSVELILKSRGYQIKKKGNLSDLLVSNIKFGDQNHESLLTCFNNKQCRKEILEYIKTGKIPSTKESLNLVSHPDFVKDEQVFTKTFEWYVGEAMVRFFQGFSFAFNVEFENVLHNQTGNRAGDYDTLVVARNLAILYFECKTGKFTHSDIQKALDRAVSLNSESVIIISFVTDGKRLLELTSKASHPLINSHQPLSKIQIKSNAESMVYEWNNCYFVSASKDFIEQMKTVLRIKEAKRVFMEYTAVPDKMELDKMGYEVTPIE